MNEKNLIRGLVLGSALCFLGALGLYFKTGSKTPITAESVFADIEAANLELESPVGMTGLKNQSPYTQATEEVASGKSLPNAEDKTTDKKTANKLSEQEKSSINAITKMLRAAVSQNLSTKSFIELIRTTGLKPVASREKDPDASGLTTIRTSNALEGTRYFHAQFFGGDKLKDFPQHVSFEIRPSADALDVATQMIDENFKGRAKLVETRADYRRWKTDSGQVVWAKVLDEEDVMESPINPRDKNDIGAVWVAIEHEIHDEDDGHSH